MPGDLTIGRVAQATGCKVQTIRYYETIGLTPPPPRTRGNTRRYDDTHVARLRFIRQARELGFSPEAIREMLGLADQPERSCAAVDAIASARLAEVEERIARIEALRDELRRMIAACSGGRIADCRIIEALGLDGGRGG